MKITLDKFCLILNLGGDYVKYIFNICIEALKLFENNPGTRKLASAAIYLFCKNQKLPFSQVEISQACEISPKTLRHWYIKLVNVLGYLAPAHSSPSHFIEKSVYFLIPDKEPLDNLESNTYHNFDQKTSELRQKIIKRSHQLLNIIKDADIDSGRFPVPIGASIVYLTMQTLPETIALAKTDILAYHLKVSEATIRSRIKEITQYIFLLIKDEAWAKNMKRTHVISKMQQIFEYLTFEQKIKKKQLIQNSSKKTDETFENNDSKNFNKNNLSFTPSFNKSVKNKNQKYLSLEKVKIKLALISKTLDDETAKIMGIYNYKNLDTSEESKNDKISLNEEEIAIEKLLLLGFSEESIINGHPLIQMKEQDSSYYQNFYLNSDIINTNFEWNLDPDVVKK